jgi:hypothetical protein
MHSFFDTYTEIMIVNMTNTKMLPLTIKNEFSSTHKIDTIDQSSLWHIIYCHLSFNGLNMLYKNKIGKSNTFDSIAYKNM